MVKKGHDVSHKRVNINWDSWYGDDTPTTIGPVAVRPKAYSSFWSERWARDDDDPIAPDGSERPATFMRHLRALRNVCSLAFGKGTVSVDWATEDISATDIEKGTIILSPRPFKDRSPQYNEWTLGERLDVLFGRALHEGAHNAYTPARSKIIAMKHGGTMMAELFNLMEDAYIETEIMGEFPGFSGYFDRKADFDFTPEEIQRRISELMRTDLRYIKEPTTESDMKLIEEQVTNFVNVMIPACKSRNDVDISALHVAGGRQGQIAEGIDKIVRNFRACEEVDLDLDTRMDATRNAYRIMCNLFSKPVADGEETNAGQFVLNGKADSAILKMFRQGGVGNSSGKTPAEEGSGKEEPKAGSSSISSETAAAINGLIEANMRDEELEAFHSGSHGTLHTKARIIDMKRKDYGDARYNQIYEQIKKHKQRLKLSLQFRSADRTYTERERPFGKIDPTRLYQIGAFNSKDVFSRKITTTAPAAHVGILLDESGSMREHVRGAAMSKDETAAATGIMLEAALRDSKSISYEMWGHTGDIGHRGTKDPQTIYEEMYGPIGGLEWHGPLLMRYLDSKNGLTDPRVLGRVIARGNNYDGYALEVVYKNMVQNAPEALRKVLIIVCDGMPAGSGYHSTTANNHVKETVSKARKSGVEVIAIFVGGLGDARAQMDLMYGRENRDWIHVPQPDNLPAAVERIAKRVLHWDGAGA